MKKFHVIALTLLLGGAFILIQSLALIGSQTAGGAARSKRKDQMSQTVSERARLSGQITVHAAGRGRPWINLQDGHDLSSLFETSRHYKKKKKNVRPGLFDVVDTMQRQEAHGPRFGVIEAARRRDKGITEAPRQS